jgi:hypothetical protein
MEADRALRQRKGYRRQELFGETADRMTATDRQNREALMLPGFNIPYKTIENRRKTMYN